MFAAAFHTSRHYILFTAMACLCILLGGPSYAAGADSLFIAGVTYYEPGVSGPGWAWADADHLELTGYAGEAIGADGDLVVTLVGQNSVVETHAPDADISMSGMEVWETLRFAARVRSRRRVRNAGSMWPRRWWWTTARSMPGPTGQALLARL